MNIPTPHPNQGLPRAERLRGCTTISKLFTEGHSGFIYPLRYVWMPSSEESDTNSILFTVPKRFHKRANRRNLLRRRVKEAYRLHKGLLPVGSRSLNIALAYSTKEILDYDHILKSIKRVLTQIAIESGRSESGSDE